MHDWLDSRLYRRFLIAWRNRMIAPRTPAFCYLRRKSTMARTASLSGFPEWLPEERLVELHVLDTLRRVFELHGFSSIETRAVETVGQLLRKGEIDKEVYGLSRLQEDEGEAAKQGSPDKSDPNALALHFDLTVPFARYVVENAGYLA